MAEARLQNIGLNDQGASLVKELRIDWSNDRHQSILIKYPHGVDEVLEALREAYYQIDKDKAMGRF